MSEDFGPPIRLKCSPFTRSPPAVTKLKRGGVGKQGNSGSVARRVHTFPRAVRDKVGKHVPWPDRGRPIWDPADPFIVAYRAAHPRVEAKWRTRRSVMTGLGAETINKALGGGGADATPTVAVLT